MIHEVTATWMSRVPHEVNFLKCAGSVQAIAVHLGCVNITKGIVCCQWVYAHAQAPAVGVTSVQAMHVDNVQSSVAHGFCYSGVPA